MRDTTAALRQPPPRHRRPGRRLAVILAAALALAILPPPALQHDDGSAWAKGNGGGGNGGGGGGNGGGGNGGGGNGGGGNGGRGDSGGGGKGGGQDNAPGLAGERGNRAGASPGRGPARELGQAFGKVRDALTLGAAGKAAREEARGRYAAAAGWGAQAGSRGLGRPVHAIDDALTVSLVARGWQSPPALDGTGFRNHGHRVSSMVEIAKALGYGAHVGALQANFGGPYDPEATADDAAARAKLEGEVAALRDALGEVDDPDSPEARAVADQLAALEAALAALGEPADAPAWDGDWRTADLDITGDGVVDLADLAAARALGVSSTDEAGMDEAGTSETGTSATGTGEISAGPDAPDDATPTETVAAVAP